MKERRQTNKNNKKKHEKKEKKKNYFNTRCDADVVVVVNRTCGLGVGYAGGRRSGGNSSGEMLGEGDGRKRTGGGSDERDLSLEAVDRGE